jgi:hypothetical protein
MAISGNFQNDGLAIPSLDGKLAPSTADNINTSRHLPFQEQSCIRRVEGQMPHRAELAQERLGQIAEITRSPQRATGTVAGNRKPPGHTHPTLSVWQADW